MMFTKIIYKKSLKILIVLIFTAITYGGFAQEPPPPPGNGGGGNLPDASNQLGGNAPVGSGVLILMGMALIYGGRQVYLLKSDKSKNKLTDGDE